MNCKMERVYVGNLPPDIRITDIDDFFKPFGNLVSIDVNHRANPVYAYVQFDNGLNAYNAVRSRHGYDYEGYTLQLRLMDNEVRKRRDATPPPPAPSMFSYERQNNDGGFNNNYGLGSNNRMCGNFSNTPFQSNSNSQWSNTNCSVMPQNMVQYPTTNRLNIPQQNMMGYSANNRSNIQPQSMMPYSSSGRSNIQQQYNTSRSDMLQTFSGNYGSNGNNYNNAGSNGNYNPNNDSYANPDFEDSYTRGLSGSGRKWFNRYLRQGLSPEMARIKALEHRTVPYLRDDHPKKNQILNNPTNAALETIGNTIISLLATNNNGIEMPGPSSSSSSRKSSQTPRNAVSRAQYFKSLEILKKFRSGREQSAKDRISKKYHTQIVKDYEQFEKKIGKPGGKYISNSSGGKLSEMLINKKKELMESAKFLGSEKRRRRFGGAQKKRFRILLEAGFTENEAKHLAIHNIDSLKYLIAIKKEYDMATKKSEIGVYRSDINYLNRYKEQSISNLSRRIIIALRDCINRMHKYEERNKLPLTHNKFISSILRDKYITAQKTQNEDKNSSNAKKDTENKTKVIAASAIKKEVNEKNNENTDAADKSVQKEVDEKKNENTNDVGEQPQKEENAYNQDITDEQQDSNEQEFEDTENTDDKDQLEQDFEDAENVELEIENDDVADENEI